MSDNPHTPQDTFSIGDEHLPECAQPEKRPCPAGQSLHGESVDEHWWSGWPGAYCMKCGAEDKDEICLAECACPCHAQFWEEYEKAIEGATET